MRNMLIRDKKLSSLSLVRDEFGNYIGCYNSDNNSIRKFENPEHNLYNIFKNFEAYFPDWEDQGFGIYVNNNPLSSSHAWMLTFPLTVIFPLHMIKPVKFLLI